MISGIIGVKNIRTKFRKDITDITFPLFEKLPNFKEIIVSDYGSNDGTKEFIQSFNFKYVYTKPNKREPDGTNMNIAKALNKAIIQTTTPYIIPISPDIIFSSNIGIEVENALKEENSVGRYRLFQFYKDANNSYLTKRGDPPLQFQIKKRGQEHYIDGFMWVMRRKMLIEIRGFDERLTCHREDRDLYHRLHIRYNPNVVSMDNVVALHIAHPRGVGLMSGMNLSYAKSICMQNWITDGKYIVNSYWGENLVENLEPKKRRKKFTFGKPLES